ncbi:MAG TPA: 4-hydroxythreonine-4-phosphate dehydrogenase PdxA [Xanthomonadaceae bacterium]|nr:4-hydroxythreonine-4-phosphate dehydrogenase PdxA [Xanthomonadaceae bacterium]
MAASPALPRLALIPGEPAGIGPELCVRVAQQAWPAALLCLADPDSLRRAARQAGLALTIVSSVAEAELPRHRPGRLLVVPEPLAAVEKPGAPDPANAPQVLATLDHAIDACMAGRLDGMVTGPVQKSCMNAAGIAFSGTTERLARRCGTPVVMMLANPELRVALATTHLPLRAVPDAITAGRLREVLTVLHDALRRDFGIARPRIAVLGLNPHAGEDGHLGREEIEIIAPLLDRLRSEGMALYGPLPADTAFLPRALRGIDAVLAMYHDQGLPVLKHSGFEHGVNITLGLPFVRVAVDHGTALDLAGTGRADPRSLATALTTAIELAARRRAAG